MTTEPHSMRWWVVEIHCDRLGRKRGLSEPITKDFRKRLNPVQAHNKPDFKRVKSSEFYIYSLSLFTRMIGTGGAVQQTVNLWPKRLLGSNPRSSTI